jgi:hypothetical protein
MLRHAKILVLTAGVGCAAGSGPAAPAPAASPEQVKPETRVERTAAQPTPLEMKPIVPSAMAADLKGIGLDPDALPPFGKLEPDKLRKLMQTFTKSLGLRCPDCHLDDFAAPTPKKRIAAKMWDEFVRGFALADGSLLYCDSCHQGHALELDRRDAAALKGWMKGNFVDRLTKKDGSENGCAVCHGAPFDPKFVDRWAH